MEIAEKILGLVSRRGAGRKRHRPRGGVAKLGEGAWGTAVWKVPGGQEPGRCLLQSTMYHAHYKVN